MFEELVGPLVQGGGITDDRGSHVLDVRPPGQHRRRLSGRRSREDRQAGWAVQYVEDLRMPFAYTAGMTAYGLPELLMTNVSPARAARVLNRSAQLQLAGRALSRPTAAPAGRTPGRDRGGRPPGGTPAGGGGDPRADSRPPTGVGRRPGQMAVGTGLLRSGEQATGARDALAAASRRFTMLNTLPSRAR